MAVLGYPAADKSVFLMSVVVLFCGWWTGEGTVFICTTAGWSSDLDDLLAWMVFWSGWSLGMAGGLALLVFCLGWSSGQAGLFAWPVFQPGSNCWTLGFAGHLALVVFWPGWSSSLAGIMAWLVFKFTLSFCFAGPLVSLVF